ncbi:DUF308 domain-containing protein, partial [Dysosmobacter sp.]|uniref:DUF308 domain-containing protein n=1 Tax=Dysosmobacter sp. TaxID=2591382 RepID=UPI002A9B1694
MKKLRMARDGYIVMSIVFYIAGLTYMLLLEISPMTICISSGIALIAYGIIKIIGYCSNDLYCLAFQYDLACGIFLIVLGVIMLCSSTKLIPYGAARLENACERLLAFTSTPSIRTLSTILKNGQDKVATPKKPEVPKT